MPMYEYLCADCGAFDSLRPMAESAAPHPCPGCGAAAPRAILTAPGLAMMPAARRHAHATNEKSSHAPRVAGHAHGPGCGCGSDKTKSVKRSEPRGFPKSRPWMISH